MNGLLDFLRAQLDDDERVAREGCDDGSPHWTRQHDPYSPGEIRDGDGYVVVHYEDSTPSVYQAEHIVRHDPARVLAEVDAKRRILDEVVDEATGLDMQVDGEFRVGSRDEVAEPYLGDVLARLLALPYADRPGYREEWRPA